MRRAVSLLLLLALNGAAVAAVAPSETKDTARKLPKMSTPLGPVTVTANRAELERGGVMLYRGNVRLVSDQLVLTGDRLELRQTRPGEFEVLVTGNPARLQHAGTDDAPPIAAQSGRITYVTRTAVVELSDGAQLERGDDLLTGERIRYDAEARRIQANGSDGGQVRIVIQQPGLHSGKVKP